MINQLIEIIGREAEIFESFLKLLEQQQEMLVKNDHDGLTRVTELQREKLVESQLLNEKRIRLVEEIQITNQIEGDLNVTRLLEIVDQKQADQLVQLQQSIMGLNDQIVQTRNQNAMLLNRSREYIVKTIEMLSRINNSDSNYNPAGSHADQRSNLAVDRRA